MRWLRWKMQEALALFLLTVFAAFVKVWVCVVYFLSFLAVTETHEYKESGDTDDY